MNKLILPAAMAASLAAGQASAHAHLEAADPRVGSTVTAAPTHLRLRFNEVIRTNASGVQLVGPDGKADLLAIKQDPKDRRSVVASLPSGLTAGRYLVRWRALSPDGHRTQGDFRFTIKR